MSGDEMADEDRSAAPDDGRSLSDDTGSDWFFRDRAGDEPGHLVVDAARRPADQLGERAVAGEHLDQCLGEPAGPAGASRDPPAARPRRWASG